MDMYIFINILCIRVPLFMISSPSNGAGLNVSHRPGRLPGHVYADSLLDGLPAAQRFEAQLYALETKWKV